MSKPKYSTITKFLFVVVISIYATVCLLAKGLTLQEQLAIVGGFLAIPMAFSAIAWTNEHDKKKLGY